MDAIFKKIKELQNEIEKSISTAKIPDLESKQSEIAIQMEKPDFWNDNKAAQQLTQLNAKLQSQIEPWRELEKEVTDLLELAQLKDDDLLEEIQSQFIKLQKRFKDLEFDLQFSGPYDNHDAILRLYSGAGGTDAQDWTEMLERMYLRWAESHNFKVEVVDRSTGEEAGIKNSTLAISGPYVYGKLKGENGVHRLVRLSPFNSDNLRQTSFAMVEVLPQIEEPKEVEINEEDLRIDVYRAGGHGGQSVNTTDSAVRITHIPTGIIVAIQNERSQLQNKETAMKILRSKLAKLQIEQHKEKIEELKGPSQSAEWGNQIRNYILHPYTLVKDTRTKYEEHNAQAVLDGKIDNFISAYLKSNI